MTAVAAVSVALERFEAGIVASLLAIAWSLPIDGWWQQALRRNSEQL